MKNEKFYSQLSTYFKRHKFRSKRVLKQDGFQTMLRAAGGTESTQGKLNDWLQLDEQNPRCQFLTQE
jgi:hypothetical protein